MRQSNTPVSDRLYSSKPKTKPVVSTDAELKEKPTINERSKLIMEQSKNAFYSDLKVEDRLRLYGMQLLDQSSSARSSSRSGSRSKREYRQKIEDFF